MIPSTVERVPQNTTAGVNRRIEEEARARVDHYRTASAGEIRERLHALDQEWDIERVLEANMGAAVLGTLILSKISDRRWSLLTAVIGGFMINHAVNGWCPPLPVWRSLGFRTTHEIEAERQQLKSLL